MTGLDISVYQKGLSLKTAKENGVEFAILRAGFTGYGSGRTKSKDSCFESFYAEAKKIGLPVGAYWYSCATDSATGKAEAEFMYTQCLKGKQFEYPIYIDIENPQWQQNNRDGNADAAIAFCEYLESKGYFVGIYASLYWFNNLIATSRLNAYTKWIACWSEKKPTFAYNAFDMWQYTNSRYITGIRCDGDISYRDFPAIIKAGGYNGYKASGTKPVSPAAEPDDGLKVGDKVKVLKAVTYSGTPFKTWYDVYDVIEVYQDKVVIGIGQAVTAAVKASNLQEVGSTKSSEADLKAGDKVKVLKAVTDTGKSFKTYYDSYDVIEVSGDRVVIGKGKTVTAAVKAKNLKKI